MGDTILSAVSEAGIDDNWCLIDNHSMYNAFGNGKYMLYIRYAPEVQYLRVHCYLGVTYTNKICGLPGYPDTVWYHSKGVSNILSLRLVKKSPPGDIQQ